MKGIYMFIIVLCVAIPCSIAQQPGNKSFKLLDDNEPFKLTAYLKPTKVIYMPALPTVCTALMAPVLKKITFQPQV